MENIIPMSWLKQMLLIFSIISASLCLIIQEWAGLTPLSIYISILWAIFIIVMSVWLSCVLLRLTLKTNSPINIEFVNSWLYKRIASSLNLDNSGDDDKSNIISDDKKDTLGKLDSIKENKKSSKDDDVLRNRKSRETQKVATAKETIFKENKGIEVNDLTKEINLKCIEIWYQYISDDQMFADEAQELLKKLLTRLFWKINLIDKMKLIQKLANVLLLHLKEYHRALRRVEKGAAANVEEAYKCIHPGSRSRPALEHMLHRLVTVLAQEFLQWELTSSLPCKLLLSIFAKKLLVTVETISSANWVFEMLLDLSKSAPNETVEAPVKQEQNILNEKGTVSVGLSDGIVSATAAVIPHSLPKSKSDLSTSSSPKDKDAPSTVDVKRPTLCLENLATEHRGLWGESISEVDSEIDEDRISPVYEEPTDFATTIARLRTVLQQKSTVTTPLHVEEKSYVIYEGSQFTNLSIPWTEFHTALDGSQQLLYCIQFDDVEQRGVDLFETTTATVRRQYSDFAQLHASLEEIPTLSHIMSDLVLPEGGRVELETYLKTLCTRLANECPPQLRHFLRPNSSAGKKADAVAPRFDRFLAKTVTGVFNTLRTVVPGFEIDQEEEPVPLPTLMPLSDIPWRFVEDIKSRSLAVELQRLVAERTEYCSVDTAYEAVDSMEDNGDSESLAHWWDTVNTSYDEELDELDLHLPLTCVTLDLVCELLAGIGSSNTLQQDVVTRWVKVIFGNVTEPVLQKTIHRVSEYLSNASFPCDFQSEIPEERVAETKEKLFQALVTQIPSDLKLFFGEDDVGKILKYLLSSYEIKKVNMDLNLQILDVLASELLISCRTNHEITVPQ